MIAAAEQSPQAIARHVANATRLLCEALHYHRHFGAPIDGFSLGANLERKRANDRRIAALALQAGQSARYSGQLCEAWSGRCPEAWAVDAIRDAMAAGWVATDRDLAACTDVVETGGAS